ncbi:hypothetical protein L873DRAFT_1814288 [Choiromyces venosus 120613-1]|uniref:Uncharacterized protein n=1 Tax=Choiromyces venosus 120613-1 TaxID=1336337 RepID=A0A3N4JKS0_9PEZI|nr:hypothetical protein L873DRAFT_1814288 [Choiromyces venosus 120613-1]
MPSAPPHNGPKVRIPTLLDMGVLQAEALCQSSVPCPTVNLWPKTHCSRHNHTCSGCPPENVWKILKQRIKA